MSWNTAYFLLVTQPWKLIVPIKVDDLPTISTAMFHGYVGLRVRCRKIYPPAIQHGRLENPQCINGHHLYMDASDGFSSWSDYLQSTAFVGAFLQFYELCVVRGRFLTSIGFWRTQMPCPPAGFKVSVFLGRWVPESLRSRLRCGRTPGVGWKIGPCLFQTSTNSREALLLHFFNPILPGILLKFVSSAPSGPV